MARKRPGSMDRVERVNVLIVDREDRRIQREADATAPKRVWVPRQDDPLKCPFYALGSELVPMPKDGLFP